MPSPIHRILVVEDDHLLLLNARLLLESAGHDVLSASDAISAISLLEASPGVTAMFADVSMPGPMDGLALAVEVYRRWPDIDVHLTSGKVELAHVALPPSATFLAKPYTAAAMLNLLAAGARRGAITVPCPAKTGVGYSNPPVRYRSATAQ